MEPVSEFELPFLSGDRVPFISEMGLHADWFRADGRSRMIKRFFNWNIKLCNRIENHLPKNFTVSLLQRYSKKTADLCARRQGQFILDVGGGKTCWYVPYFQEDTAVSIIVVDISEEQLKANQQTTLLAVADATVALPIAESSIDIVATRSVIEHLRSVEPFIAESHRVLKKGGVIVSVFPCRYTPFSIINRILPNRIAQSILYYIFPKWQEACGFKAYYDNCYFSAMMNILKNNGFVISDVSLRYYQSIYYKFFVPLYLLMLAYDFLLYKMAIKNLSCQIMVVAEKK